MSGWTRALNATSAVEAAAVPSSDSLTADMEHLGQGASSALSALFEARVQAMMADQLDLDAQQAIIDRLREGVEVDEQSATTSSATAAGASASASAVPAASPLGAGGAALLTLASFAHALHRLSSFTLLGESYAQLLDQLSWDLCDVLLPALQREWMRVAARTHQSGISDVQLEDGQVTDVEALATAASRPIASPLLTLLQHLLGEVFAHANPRECALTLLSFYERSVHISADDEDDGGEGDDQPLTDADKDAEVELVVTTQPSSKAASASTMASYHRLALAEPLLDLLASLLPRVSAKSSAATAAGPVSPPTNTLNSRQVELYQQLFGVFTHTMLQVSQQVSQRSDGASSSVAPNQPRLAVERCMWVGMHVRLLHKCIDIAQPVLSALSAEAAPASSDADAAASSVLAPSSPLRVSMLTFLFQQLSRFFSLYGPEAPALQSILDGNRALAAQKTAASDAAGSLPGPVTSVTPHLALLLSLLFRLCSCVDQCGVGPRELLSFFRHKRRLEQAVEREELQRWEEQDDGEWGAESDGEEGSDGEDGDGNAHDDEFDSQDGFGENAALQAFESEQARKRKPPSALQLLRRELAALPTYNIQGIGSYLATAYGYQYFWRIKPARMEALAARQSATVAAAASVAAAPVVDEPLAALLSSLPDIGSRLLSESQRVSPRLLLDSVAPYLAGLLFHGLQNGETSFVAQGIAMATALWAILPPGAISIEGQPASGDADANVDEEDVDSMENSGSWILSESLLQCMYVCPPSWPSLRSSLLLLWKNLLSCLSVNTRFRMLQLSISVCTVASVQAVILQRIKEEIAAAWNAAPALSSSTSDDALVSDRASFLTPDLLASLHSYVTQAEENFLSSLDLMLSALNLFRFLFLRERADANAAAANANATASAAPLATSGGRLGLLLPAVKSVWLEKWSDVAATAQRETGALDADIAADRAAPGADAPDAKAAIAQAVLLRNQAIMAGDLANLVIEHLQE